MLHTVNKSPFEKNSLDTCLRLSKAGSCVLLLEDGVYGALRGTSMESRVCASMQQRKFYALSADLKARGLQSAQLIAGIEAVGYDQFVELVVRCGSVQTWL